MLDVQQAQFPLPFAMNTKLSPLHSFMFGAFGDLTSETAAAWPVANTAFYIPFRLPFRMNIASITILNGATVSGNVDGGIYNADGTRLTSTGSIAQTGANVQQILNFTDIVLGPGLYFVAIAKDNTTGALFRYSWGLENIGGIHQQATAFPLPATMTPAFNSVANSYIPNFTLDGDRTHDDSLIGFPMLPTICPYSHEASSNIIWASGAGSLRTSASAAWPLANGAFTFPFVLSETARIRRLFCLNGATVSGNIDMAIYAGNHATPFLLISSGSIAQAGVSTIQSAAIDITLEPGRYLFALACSNTTATFRRSSGAFTNFLSPAAYQWNSASFPLGTLGAAAAQQNYAPVCGISRYN